MPKGNKASFYRNPLSSVVAQAGSKKKNKSSKSSKKTLLPNPNLPSGGGTPMRKKAESKGAQTTSAPKATDTQVNDIYYDRHAGFNIELNNTVYKVIKEQDVVIIL
jgi:hypothetical protein